MTHKHIAISVLFGTLAFSAARVEASIVIVDGLTPGKYAKVDTSEGKFEAGQFNATLDSKAITTFCVDLDHYVREDRPYEVNVRNMSELTNGIKAAKIYNYYRSQVTNGKTGSALQLAIWKTIEDGSKTYATDFHHGFKAEGDNADLAKTWLKSNDWINASSNALWLDPVYHPDHKYNQGMITSCPVPEPASIAILGLGVTAMLRRKLRK